MSAGCVEEVKPAGLGHWLRVRVDRREEPRGALGQALRGSAAKLPPVPSSRCCFLNLPELPPATGSSVTASLPRGPSLCWKGFSLSLSQATATHLSRCCSNDTSLSSPPSPRHSITHSSVFPPPSEHLLLHAETHPQKWLFSPFP